MLRRVVSSFAPSRQPLMARQSYRYELVNALTYPTAIAMVEGGVVGVLAQKAFDVGPIVFATIMAAPNFANLASFFWAHASRGRPKVRYINLLQVIALVCIAGIAVLPTGSWWGGVALMVLIVVGRCVMTGIVTLRSLVWRMNYPRHLRAQITGRLTLLQSLIMAVAPLLGYRLLDYDVTWFRVVYPLSAAVAVLGVLHFSRIRLRGERELLRYEVTPAAQPQKRGETGSIYEYAPPPKARGPGEVEPDMKPAPPPPGPRALPRPAPEAGFWGVLKRDRTFRRYMFWQFVSGVSNMAGETVIVAAIATMTVGQPSEWFTSICFSTTLPMFFAVATLPYLSRYMDRVHVAQFRAVQGWWWITNQSLNWLALWVFVSWQSLWLAFAVLGLARVCQGVARAGGMLAWNLGHNDFADRRMVAVYMGIHVTLTGVRGAIAPFAAVLLWAGTPAVPWLNLPAWDGIGYHVFLITAALAVWAEWGFHALARDIAKKP